MNSMLVRVINQPYEYAPLRDPSKQIRILDVAAPEQDNNDEEPLHGLLRTVNLDHTPKFAALSYIWGDPTQKHHSIHFGSQSIALTSNCHSAISHLRRALKPFSIWIHKLRVICDAIVKDNSTIVIVKLKHKLDEIRTGIAFPKVQVDDKVCLLPGVPIPMVLRPVSTSPQQSADDEVIGAPQVGAESPTEASSVLMQLVSPAGVVGMMQSQEWPGGDVSNLPYISII